jgi:uncharacterized protein (DUF302 family)
MSTTALTKDTFEDTVTKPGITLVDSIGLLLPCNVVVRAIPAGTVVEALDPQVMVTLTGRPELKPVADEVGRRLARALAAHGS